MPSRRRVLLTLAGAALAGCGPTLAPRPVLPVDASFAEGVMRALGGARVRAELLRHPALAAIHRHRRLSGAPPTSDAALLDQVLRTARANAPRGRALAAWRARLPALRAAADAAGRYLPGAPRFTGSIHLVMGYDIGVAAPPDVLINLGHPHFERDPGEVPHYVTHEAHHVGFMRHRTLPPLAGLTDPRRLKAVVRTFTQLEGMGVHAAWWTRRAAGAEAGDADYRVYGDAVAARAVTRRYKALWARLDAATTLSQAEVGEVLTAMSSGQRLWYRFGALVAQRLERAQGRAALVASVRVPAAFDDTADALLALS